MPARGGRQTGVSVEGNTFPKGVTHFQIKKSLFFHFISFLQPSGDVEENSYQFLSSSRHIVSWNLLTFRGMSEYLQWKNRRSTEPDSRNQTVVLDKYFQGTFSGSSNWETELNANYSGFLLFFFSLFQSWFWYVIINSKYTNLLYFKLTQKSFKNFIQWSAVW